MTKKNSKLMMQNRPSVKDLTVFNNLDPVSEDLFVEAFTHSSYANEYSCPDNERLEFLGDSVLSLIVVSFLFHKFPHYKEGQLSKLKSVIVSAPILAEFSRELQLDQHLLLGEGEIKSNGRNKLNIQADLFEAFLGAFYLNFGLETTTKMGLPLIEKVLPEVLVKYHEIDAKTNLQEVTQAIGLKPTYQTVKIEGPPHERFFTVEVLIKDRVIGSGTGSSLKEAENKAAVEGLKHFHQ
jgi:ribonuclease-3